MANHEINLGKPLYLENATEKIWLAGLLHNQLLIDKGLQEKPANAPKQQLIHLFDAPYYMRRLGDACGKEVADKDLVAHYSQDFEPTHLVLADSLEYAYFLILRHKDGNLNRISHFLKLGNFDSISFLIRNSSKLRTIVFSVLNKPGAKKEYQLDWPHNRFVVENRNGVLVGRKEVSR